MHHSDRLRYRVLIQALATGTALELERLYLGGNKTSVAGMALATHLKQSRGDLLVCWKKALRYPPRYSPRYSPRSSRRVQELRGAASLCTVGNVHNNSPAHAAGLRSGDSVVAFGPVRRQSKPRHARAIPDVFGCRAAARPLQVQSADFKSVSESLVPVVKAHVAKPIDVVCVRMDDGAQALSTGQPAPRLPVPRRIEIAPLLREMHQGLRRQIVHDPRGAGARDPAHAHAEEVGRRRAARVHTQVISRTSIGRPLISTTALLSDGSS